ncbi:MAG: hypothetical protein GF341_01790 [candidate division Zixibacteria bacterium]|nr:hypothetical protein [candidate division Zixibacteria bacterium]
MLTLVISSSVFAQSPDHDSTAIADTTYWWPTDAIAKALSYIRLTPDDLALRDDYYKRDSCRLTLVDSMMRRPDQMPVFLESTANDLFGTSAAQSTVRPELIPLAQLAVGEIDQSSIPDPTASGVPEELQRELTNWPEGWSNYLRVALWALSNHHWVDMVLSDLNSDDRAFVIEQTPEFVLEDEEDKNKSAEVLDSLQQLEDSYAVRFADLAGDIDWKWVFTHGVPAVDKLIEWLPGAPPPLTAMRRIETDAGLIVFGSDGDDVFTGNATLIIDPGGNDRYELTPLAPGQNRLILDYGGNDEYAAAGHFVYGAAQFGWGMLIDFAGDDLYRTGDFSLGCGWFGVGVLLDLDGRDIYLGDICTQGAGGFGLGLCMDRGRDTDQYTSRLFSQGFGFAAGVGVLADDGGNDLYYCGGKYEDILRYRDHYLSLGQGFAYGIRPHFSGGIGLLLDNNGNDLYSADIFGQGCSYWWAFGGVYDGGGNDQYVAFQYAQGSATHLTAGCLLDAGGDDRYESKGVSQGCGHDWAPGFLIDLSGNDRYSATDLSQAAGSANGVGVLIDMAGDDGYQVTSDKNTHGYGNPRREYGSIGLFLDLSGFDRYSGPGSEGKVWIGNSRWGIGVDADSLWLVPEPMPTTEEE